MKKSIVTALLLGIVAAVSVTVCCGSDLVVPDWRGTDGTTYQQWSFDTNASPASPEVIVNPYGGATATVEVGEFGSGWLHHLEGLGNETGYWDLGRAGPIEFNIALSSPANTYTELWVQLTFFVDLTDAPTLYIPGAVRLGGETLVVEDVETGGQWLMDQSMWRIDSSSEPIVLTAESDWMGSVVSQAIVDTRSVVVPEPASLSVILFGGGAALLRRRLRR